MERSLPLLPFLKDTFADTEITTFSAKQLVIQLLQNAPNVSGLLSALFPSVSSPNMSFPMPPTLYGRENCVAQVVQRIQKQLDEGCSSPLAIVGPPGIGKSSIAFATAHSDIILAHFLNGRYRVPCQDISSLDAFFHVLWDTFRLILPRSLGSVGDIHIVINALRKQNCPQLIILDDFETIWDVVEIRSDIERILRQICSIPDLTLLITMRGTDTPSVVQWKQEIQPYSPEAARLAFLSIYQGHDDHVEQLLEAVDYVPLAVALLAQRGQADMVTPLELLKRLGAKEAGFLELGDGRQQSLDGSVRSSLESTRMKSSVVSNELLSILSVLPSGLAPTALHNILSSVGSSQRDEAISTVTKASLAFVLPSEHLQLLSPVRSYILRYHKLEDETREKLYSYYFLQAERGLCRRGDKNMLSIVRSLNEEEHNMVAVLDHALDNECTIAIKAVLQYSTLLCSIKPHLNIMKKAVALARKLGNQELLAPCLERLGEMGGVIGQYIAARPVFTEAIAIYQHLGDPLGAARCMVTHGSDLCRCGYSSEGLRFLEQAYAEFCRSGDLSDQAECLLSIGKIILSGQRQEGGDGVVKDGQGAVKNALAMFRELDEPLGVARCQIAVAQFEPCNISTLEDALKCVEQFGEHSSSADCLVLLSRKYQREGRCDDSRVALERALGLQEQLGRRLDAAFCMRWLAELHISQRCFDKAIPLLEKAVPEFWYSSFVFAGAESRFELGFAYMEEGHLSKALLALEMARREHVRNSTWHLAAQCLVLQYCCHTRGGHHEDAARLIAEHGPELRKYGFLRDEGGNDDVDPEEGSEK